MMDKIKKWKKATQMISMLFLAAVLSCCLSKNVMAKSKPVMPPENVSVWLKSATSLKIKWNKSENADGYIIYKYNKKAKKYVRVHTAKKNQRSWVDQNLKTGKILFRWKFVRNIKNLLKFDSKIRKYDKNLDDPIAGKILDYYKEIVCKDAETSNSEREKTIKENLVYQLNELTYIHPDSVLYSYLTKGTIKERKIDFNNIISDQTHTTTTRNNGRWITMSVKLKYGHRCGKSIICTRA